MNVYLGHKCRNGRMGVISKGVEEKPERGMECVRREAAESNILGRIRGEKGSGREEGNVPAVYGNVAVKSISTDWPNPNCKVNDPGRRTRSLDQS